MIVLLNVSKMVLEVRYFENKWTCWPMSQFPDWNRVIPCNFFVKTLIQLCLFCSFLYSLTYYTKEVIKGKILWKWNKKMPFYEAATAWNRRIRVLFFSKNWSNCFFLLIFLFSTCCFKDGIKINMFVHYIQKC